MDNFTEDKKWYVLLVDDDVEIRDQVEERVQGQIFSGIPGRLILETISSFEEGVQKIKSFPYDVVILDIRQDGFGGQLQDSQAGLKVLSVIKSLRFVPIIFYTAVPHLAEPAHPPTTFVVAKPDGISALIRSLQSIFASGLPQLNRALVDFVRKVQKDYMWDFVSENWTAFGESSDHVELAYLLVRRLAMSLADAKVEQLVSELGGTIGENGATNVVHPMRYYIVPPLATEPHAGDLFYEETTTGKRYWVLLTPSCDIAQNKADFVLMAPCDLLTDQPEYKLWIAKGAKDKSIESLLRNNRNKQPERFFFLPGIVNFMLPDMIVDFQQVQSVICSALESTKQKYHRIASLDNPYAESLLARFSKYLGRLGTPDLDVRNVVSRLRSAGNASTNEQE